MDFEKGSNSSTKNLFGNCLVSQAGIGCDGTGQSESDVGSTGGTAVNTHRRIDAVMTMFSACILDVPEIGDLTPGEVRGAGLPDLPSLMVVVYDSAGAAYRLRGSRAPTEINGEAWAGRLRRVRRRATQVPWIEHTSGQVPAITSAVGRAELRRTDRNGTRTKRFPVHRTTQAREAALVSQPGTAATEPLGARSALSLRFRRTVHTCRS